MSNDNDDTVVRLRRRVQRTCPICGAPTSDAFRPFCSRRCADIDLGRWLNGSYRIPTEEEDADGPEEGGRG